MDTNSTPDLLFKIQKQFLTTAEILYYLPDFPDVLQVFLWQNVDESPDFPRIHAFLLFWENNIEGRLYSVKIAQADRIYPTLIFAKDEFKLQ
jgi:uncharacterized protein Usg